MLLGAMQSMDGFESVNVTHASSHMSKLQRTLLAFRPRQAGGTLVLDLSHMHACMQLVQLKAQQIQPS